MGFSSTGLRRAWVLAGALLVLACGPGGTSDSDQNRSDAATEQPDAGAPDATTSDGAITPPEGTPIETRGGFARDDLDAHRHF